MPLLKKLHYTADDYWNLPEGERAELIDGTLYNMAPPSRIHQKLVMELSATVREFIKKNNGKCQVYPAPFAVNLDAENKDWVEPDISVICDPNKLTDRGCSGAPDLIFEIVSPSSRKLDYGIKNGIYSQSGVREYWIVDPKRETVLCYYFEGDDYPHMYTFDDIIPVMIYDGKLEINFADIKDRLI